MNREEKLAIRKILLDDGVCKRFYLTEEESAKYVNTPLEKLPSDIGCVIKKDPSTGEEKKRYYKWVLDEEMWKLRLYAEIARMHSKVTFLWILAVIGFILSIVSFIIMLIL